MTQKLLVMERDTKEELQKAINKHLKDAQFKVTGLSILPQRREGLMHANVNPNYFEAWMIIDDNSDLLAGFD